MAIDIEDFLAEIKAERAELRLPIEGLRNYQRLDIQNATRTYVDEELFKYERRNTLLLNLEFALEAIISDGYPDIPVRPVPFEVYEDLASENKEVDAGQAVFSQAVEPIELNPTAGAPEPK